MKRTASKSLGHYTNKNAEKISLSISKWIEPSEANYRMFFVEAKHDKWGHRVFSVFITKQFIEHANDAGRFAESTALDSVKKHLDVTENGETPLFFPLLNEGWGIL